MTDMDESPEREVFACHRCGREFANEDRLIEHEEGL